IYAAFLFSLGLTATLILLALNQTDSNYLALFTLFYTLGLWFSARTNYRRNLSNLVLAQEKLALVESLQLTNKQLLRQVNETQNAEQNAREAEGRFRTLANATSEGVVLYENGRIIDCNENITTMLGYTRAELLDKNIEHLFTQTDRFLVLDLLSHNDGIPYELRCEDKEGNNFPVELVKRKLPLHDRNLYVFALRDISELKYMSEIKDQFISTVSHELRTPITSIHASLALALGGVAGDIPEKLQSLLSIAHQNSERLNLLINDLLDIQKLEIGKLHFNYETVDVTDVLKHSIELNSAYFNKHHIKVVLQDIDQKLFIHVDRDRFIQVLTNLLSNAAKFSPADSEVSISLSLQTELLQIHIHDQGPGIPPEFQEKIFQRFSQADASNTRVHGGSGLGLYISKKILHEMKSDIDFRSTAGEGTTFTITLPVTTK
ncbi:MAG: ATP-binding protein, partial [Gammaproteobacteria bacterium]|nr:ATP-binding protein [Gammaproteobacteria bacterium]